MATPFNDFVNNEFYPKLYQYIDIVFPDLHFTQRGDRWISPLKKDGSQPKHPTREKTVIKANRPHAIMEGGEQPEEILKWIIRKYGYNSPYEAAKAIGERIGVTPPEFNNAEFAAYQEKIEAYNAATEEMQRALFTPEAAPILEQLTKGRGYTEEEIDLMGLGYINAEIAAKYREKVYLPKGVENFNQIVIPFISGGRIEGFKFRATNEQARAKYINSRFSKKNFLFGLSAIPMTGNLKEDRLIILVDGELKALYMKVKGFKNVVSGAGSAGAIISDEQIAQAKQKGVKHIVIIADNESTETERANEANKINNTLQMLNRAEISGYVVYLPHEDLNRKEDAEDFLQKNGVDKLTEHIKNAEGGARFRTRQLFKKYIQQQGEGELSDIQVTNLYGELFSLMSEYEGQNIAFIENTAREFMRDMDKEWIKVIKQGAEAAREQKHQRQKEYEARKLFADIETAVKNGDINGALTRAAQAKKILQDDRAAEFAPMFTPRKWSDTTEKLKERKIGIETLYKFKRGNETDLFILPSGAVTIIAAPTNHGKSTMLQNLALQAAEDERQQGAILYFTFEEDAESVSVQFLSKAIGQPISRDNKRSIKSFYQGRKEFVRDEKAFKTGENKLRKLIESGKLWIYGTEAINGISVDVLTPLTRMITQATKEIPQGVAAVFIDYVQLIQPDERIKNRAEELKIICTELKNLAVRLNIPLILAAQFNREGSKSPYELEAESLGEGGDIERAAAVIVGLWNTSKKPRQNSKYDENNKIWNDESRNYKITFDTNNPKIYLRLLKSRGETTGGEALLNCNLNVGIIEPNTTRKEIKDLRAAEIPDRNLLSEMEQEGEEKELPF